MQKANSFFIAAKIRKTTLRATARKFGCSPSLLSMVLSGKRQNKRITRLIDRFIKKEFLKMSFASDENI
jgi:lambda repressor-like predicted transcriptional regulator